MESIDRQIIRQKLTIIKKIISNDRKGNTFIIANRDKNRNFMLEYGLLINDIKNIILDIEIDDYYKGPEKDEAGFDGEVWIFTPNFQDIKLYVKLRLSNNILVVCISIHEYGIY